MTEWTIRHAFYGCDTGCCGIRLESGDINLFRFGHCDELETKAPGDLARELFKEVKPGDTVSIGKDHFPCH